MKVIVPLVIILFLIGAASSCGSGSKSNAASAAPAAKAPTFAQVLNKNYSRSLKLCDSYNTLVNQGWNDNDIYQNLSDAGTFDQFYGQGREFFNAMVKWCYQN